VWIVDTVAEAGATWRYLLSGFLLLVGVRPSPEGIFRLAASRFFLAIDLSVYDEKRLDLS
jgi:hypothetical protein